MTGPYLGKWRGTVVDNTDPESRGRLKVFVPGVANTTLVSWAMPCFPVAGLLSGFFAVPPPQAGVWVEFEQGERSKPIWSGCYWTQPGDPSVLARSIPAPIPGFVMTTAAGNALVVSDAGGPSGAGGIVLKSMSGAMIIVNDTGITIQNGKGAIISMTGNVVDVNLGALTIK